MADGRILSDGPAGQVLAQTQVLAEAAVERPQLIRLAEALGWSETPLSVDAFVDLLALRQKEGS